MVLIFPNLCLWRRSLRSNLGGIDFEKLYRVTLKHVSTYNIFNWLQVPPSIPHFPQLFNLGGGDLASFIQPQVAQTQYGRERLKINKIRSELHFFKKNWQ